MAYISTFAVGNKDIEACLEAFSNLKIPRVELGSNHTYIKEMEEIVSSYSFDYILHNYFPPPKEPFVLNLASLNPDIRKRSISQLKTSLDFCRAISSNFLSFHAGFRLDADLNFKFDLTKDFQPYDKSFSLFVDAVMEVAKYAEDLGIRIAIENNVVEKKNIGADGKTFLMMYELSEFKKFAKAFEGRENVGLLVDLGHLKVSSHWMKFDAEQFLEDLPQRVFEVHIHDNNGEKDEHGLPKKDGWAYKMLAKPVLRKGIWTIESTNLNGTDIQKVIGEIEKLEKGIK